MYFPTTRPRNLLPLAAVENIEFITSPSAAVDSAGEAAAAIGVGDAAALTFLALAVTAVDVAVASAAGMVLVALELHIGVQYW